MGLVGNQSLNYMQNRTLNESATNGVNPYLFEVYESGQYLFRGQVELAGQPFEEIQPDKNGERRKVWVFPLQVVGSASGFQVPGDLVAKKQQRKERQAKRLSDEELFTRAVHSRRHPSNRQVSSTTYERNVFVAELTKRRSNGICQLCKRPAPFHNMKNEPYLESHHIIWLSQGGEDTVENSVALCPNCHKKMHILNLKDDRKKLNQEAQKYCCQLTIDGGVIYV
jgi:5-methylcytosine-specific restriction protein A